MPVQQRRMKVSLFIVTHAKDAQWLRYCLRSVEKFCSGFHRVNVIFPSQEKEQFGWLDKFQVHPIAFGQAPPPLGHLHHIAVKLEAHRFDTESDYLAFVDSDCIFFKPTTPETYFVVGKPILMVERYDSLLARGDGAVCWQEGTQRALGFPVRFEAMRCHPAVHHRDLFPEVIKHIEHVHGMPLLDYVFRQKHTFPCGVNDFNVLGVFAMETRPKKYHIIDLTFGQEQRPPTHLYQFWSHSPPDKPQDVWHEGQLLGGVIPQQMIEEALK